MIIKKSKYFKSHIKKCEEELLRKVESKKIVCFGAGINAKNLLESKIFSDKISFIIDNDINKQGVIFCGVKIESPDILHDLSNENIVILITTRYYHEISNQLEQEYGFIKDKNYYIIVNYLSTITEYQGLINALNKTNEFMRNIPDNQFEKVNSNSKRMSILIDENYVCLPYNIALCFLLKSHGYDVSLIIDNYNDIKENLLYHGCSHDFNELLENTLNIIRQKWSNINIIYANNNSANYIFDDEDINNQLRLLFANSNSLAAKTDYACTTTSESEISQIIKEVYDRYNIRIANFLYENKEKLNVIISFTGLHWKNGYYNYYGKKFGLRMPSHDNNLISTDDICCHLKDITKIINSEMFTKNQINSIVELSRVLFEKRVNFKQDLENYTFKLADVESMKKSCQISSNKLSNPYDIVIPLNIVDDAAALNIKGCFNDFADWLTSTVEYIIENTNASVIVREHPGQQIAISAMNLYFEFISYRHLLEKYEKNVRYKYISASDDVNTYKCIEKCKIVLPWTSTIGIESALLKKIVIQSQDCYYSSFSFVKRAFTKDEYYKLISKYLKEPFYLSQEDINIAYLAFFLNNHSMIDCEFFEWSGIKYNNICTGKSFYDNDFKSFLQIKNIDDVVKITAEGIPAAYLMVKRLLDENDA